MALFNNDIKITKEAKEYADTMVGPRGERETMDNRYEWDAIAGAFSQGQAKPAWVSPDVRQPQWGQRVFVLIDTFPHITGLQAYIVTWRGPERKIKGWMPIPDDKP
jgi:hypothetical protein